MVKNGWLKMNDRVYFLMNGEFGLVILAKMLDLNKMVAGTSFCARL